MDVFPRKFNQDFVKKLYSGISYFNEQVVFEASKPFELDKLYYLRLIPEYIELKSLKETYCSHIVPHQNWGYSILLKEFDSIDTYLTSQFNSKKRQITRRYVKRLEACFNIKYVMYHGNMEKQNYRFIMNSLRTMIELRFSERNEKHKNIDEWTKLEEETHRLILNKEASLFVIYNEDEPIEISLNYHFNKVLFSYISSYDIDYAKFGLGHVEIYKQIEWCLNNGYILFEMGVGGMDYKRRWSNNIYQYNQYIVYSKQSTSARIQSKILKIKYQLKEHLKSIGINEIKPRLNEFLKKEAPQSNNHNPTLNIQKISNENDTIFEACNPLKNTDKKHLKRTRCDFLYATVEHLSDVSYVKASNGKTYLKGKKHFSEIIF